MADKSKTGSIVESVGHELKENPPAILSSTKRKFGSQRAEAQRKAILLNKSRRLGASISKPKSLGGKY